MCFVSCCVQFADEHVDDKGDVLLTAQQQQLQWGLWLNTHKNPRFKLVDFGGLGVAVEVPKQIALATVAIRMQASTQSTSQPVAAKRPQQAAGDDL